MYAVSEAYKAAMKKPVQHFRLRGQIKIGVHVFGFTEENILKGSFSISNQCSGSEDVEIGTVYTAELSATFIQMDLTRYQLKDQPITVSLELLTDDGWEGVPLGVFYINEADWTSWGVEVTAYDAMSKFDKNITINSSQGSIYRFLYLACRACGVELGMEESETLILPNGGESLSIYEENDIETWRDLISWCAQTAGSFATINRDGKLILKQYTTTAVDTIDDYHRYSGAKFSDFETRYTGVSMVNIAAQTTSYYGLDVDDGLTYNLGSNPLVQYGLDDTLEKQRRAILNALAVIDYVPMEVSMIGNPAYDLGDVLVFADGIADSTKLYCITKYDWSFNGQYKVTGVGKNPALSSAKSKVDKNIAGLLSKTSEDSIHYYDYQNAEEIHIGDGETGQIIEFRYATTKDTHVDFHAEIKYELSTTEVVNEKSYIYTENDGILRVGYDLNGEHITDYAPVETRLDGTHLLHLTFTWSATANVIGSFKVSLNMTGGEVDIGIGHSRAYIAGQGLVGDGSWDGSVQIEDTVAPISVYDFIAGQYSDTVTVIFSEAKDYAPNDTIAGVNVADYLLGAFTDRVERAQRLHRFDVPYSSGIMTYDGVTYEDGVWKNAEGYDVGTLTTPVCSTDTILQITSKHSGDDVAYIVSFDQGTTWWLYANSWVEPDYSKEVYGMFEGTMRAISSSVWAEKLNGSIMIRAILTESATVTDIQIYTEVIEE